MFFCLGLAFWILTSASPCLGTDFISSSPVSISASIGENRVTIDGYTSPDSRVELSNSRVFSVTYSDNTGYFTFDQVLLPKNPGDLCLSAVDDSQRPTSPICIPAPPTTNFHTNIGLIILPPTLTLDTGQVKPNSTSLASGQSIPNSTVNIYLYQAEDRAPVFPKAVHAFGLPVFSVKTDASGNYSFNLPTALSSYYRLYSTVLFHDNPSPKSNTLLYQLPSLFYLFWQTNSWLVITLFFFVTTLSFFFYLLYLYFHFPSQPRYLPVVFSYPLATI